MKKLKPFIILFLFLIGTLSFNSCSENESIEKTEQKFKAKDLEFIGIEHNIMLEKSYDFLKENKISNKSSKIRKDLESFLISTVEKNNKYPDYSNKMGIENIKLAFGNKRLSFKNSISSNEELNLSEKVKYYLDNIYEILGEVDFSENDKIEKLISELERDVQNEEDLKNEELLIIFSATQTAKYSYNYWKNNSDKWIDLNPNSNRNQRSPGGDLVKADVTGAVGAAVGAAAANFVLGAGTVAYGGAIIAGGVGNSAIEGINQLIDWLF